MVPDMMNSLPLMDEDDITEEFINNYEDDTYEAEEDENE